MLICTQTNKKSEEPIQTLSKVEIREAKWLMLWTHQVL